MADIDINTETIDFGALAPNPAPEGETVENAESTPAEPETKPEPPKKDWREQRMGEISAKKRQAEEEAKRLRDEADYWKQKALGTPAAPAEPKVEDFPTYADFERAVRARDADKITETVLTKIGQTEAAKAQEKAEAATMMAYEQGMEAASKAVPDLVAAISHVEVTAETSRDIFQLGSEGPYVAYVLAKNPELAHAISDLPPTRRAIELGKLAERTAAQRRKPSTAPAPARPIAQGGGGSVPGVYNPNMSDAEFARTRHSQLRRKTG